VRADRHADDSTEDALGCDRPGPGAPLRRPVADDDGDAVPGTDVLAAVHQSTSTFAVFDLVVEPVMEAAGRPRPEAAALERRSSMAR
jgi:hypothetical protein